MTLQNFTLLDLKHCRPLYAVVAQRIVATLPGDPRNACAQSIFRRLSPVDQMRCRAEMLNCRKAMRGEVEASLR